MQTSLDSEKFGCSSATVDGLLESSQNAKLRQFLPFQVEFHSKTLYDFLYVPTAGITCRLYSANSKSTSGQMKTLKRLMKKPAEYTLAPLYSCWRCSLQVSY